MTEGLIFPHEETPALLGAYENGKRLYKRPLFIHF